jgi:lipopolysaccharide transport system ATP-binding protein
LVVDEVLSVGDMKFQQKSLGKMQNIAGEGRTVLFVSHNLASIRKLCARAILLESGAIVADGPTQQVIGQYFDTLNKDAAETITNAQFDLEPNLPMQIRQVQLLSNSRETVEVNQALEDEFYINIQYQVREPIQSAYIMCSITSETGEDVIWTYDGETEQFGNRRPGEFVSEYTIPRRMLTAGKYYLRCAIVDTNRGVIHYPGIAFAFTITDTVSLLAHRNIRWPATVGFNPTWRTWMIYSTDGS